MRRTATYVDASLGRLERVKDFLPPPDRLALKEDGVKVTLFLSRRSVVFLKAHAGRSKVPYQKMIRSLVDGYAAQYGVAMSNAPVDRAAARKARIEARLSRSSTLY